MHLKGEFTCMECASSDLLSLCYIQSGMRQREEAYASRKDTSIAPATSSK